jgi:hypothetical protein
LKKKLGSKNFRQNLLNYWREHLGNPYGQSDEWFVVTPMSKIFETGNHVPFSADLISFVSPIIPESDYIISSFIDVPHPAPDGPNYDPRFQEKLNITGIPCSQPEWTFKSILLSAYPLHRVWDKERVKYYKKRMMANNCNNSSKRNYKYLNFNPEERDFLQSHMHLQEYIPAVVVLTTPRILSSHGDDWGLDGLVLDGHNKIQAALEIGGPVRVIMIEKKEGEDSDFPRCECFCDDDWICEVLFDNIKDYYHPKPRRKTRHSKKKSSIPDPTDIFVNLK